MEHAVWKRPAFWVVTPAAMALLLALLFRPMLWATAAGAANHHYYAIQTVGHEQLFLGLVFLATHWLATFMRENPDALPFTAREASYGQRVVAVALLDIVAIASLYVVAFNAWHFHR